MGEDTKDTHQDYTFVKKIGQGSYGEVWLSNYQKDKKKYVIKIINLSRASVKERRAAQQESQLLFEMKHPNIVLYKDSFERNSSLYIVMGFCEGGDLYSRLKEQLGVALDERQVVEWFVQITMALQYMHEKNILHRDLKTQNIFLTKSKIIKVGDFGIARVLESSHDMATTLIGTPYYMSPELFSNKPYNHKSDIWALGCCVYEMATLKHAFNARDFSALSYKILKGRIPEMPKQYSSELLELIRAMLNSDAEKRPTVNKILRDSYIRKNIQIFLEGTKSTNQRAGSARPSSSRGRNSAASSTPSTPANRDKSPSFTPARDKSPSVAPCRNKSPSVVSDRDKSPSTPVSRPSSKSALVVEKGSIIPSAGDDTPSRRRQRNRNDENRPASAKAVGRRLDGQSASAGSSVDEPAGNFLKTPSESPKSRPKSAGLPYLRPPVVREKVENKKPTELEEEMSKLEVNRHRKKSSPPSRDFGDGSPSPAGDGAPTELPRSSPNERARRRRHEKMKNNNKNATPDGPPVVIPQLRRREAPSPISGGPPQNSNTLERVKKIVLVQKNRHQVNQQAQQHHRRVHSDVTKGTVGQDVNNNRDSDKAWRARNNSENEYIINEITESKEVSEGDLSSKIDEECKNLPKLHRAGSQSKSSDEKSDPDLPDVQETPKKKIASSDEKEINDMIHCMNATLDMVAAKKISNQSRKSSIDETEGGPVEPKEATMGRQTIMQNRMLDLRKVLLHTFGMDILAKAYEILDKNVDGGEFEKELRELMPDHMFEEYGSKIWQLKYWEESNFQ